MSELRECCSNLTVVAYGRSCYVRRRDPCTNAFDARYGEGYCAQRKTHCGEQVFTVRPCVFRSPTSWHWGDVRVYLSSVRILYAKHKAVLGPSRKAASRCAGCVDNTRTAGRAATSNCDRETLCFGVPFQKRVHGSTTTLTFNNSA